MRRFIRIARIGLGYLVLDVAIVLFPDDYRPTIERAVDELFGLRWNEASR